MSARSAWPTIRRVAQVASHRNGVGGEPFHVVLFTATGGAKGDVMMATVFEAPGHVAVVRVAPLSDPKVGAEFGLNSYRGDYYEDDLRAVIADWQASRFPASQAAS